MNRKAMLLGWVFAAAAIAPATSHAFTDVLSRKIASWRVMTSQVATAAKAQINARINIAQAQMAAHGVLASAVEQLELYQTFSMLTGQGAQVCDAVNQRNDLDGIALARSSYKFVAVPRAGRVAVPAESYEVTRGGAQMDSYCSAEEHNLGLCRSRFDGMAGFSSNYNKLMTAEQFTTKQLRGAEEFIANMVPPPAQHQAAASCDIGCQAARLRSLQIDATSSMIAATMAMQLSSHIGTKTFASKK